MKKLRVFNKDFEINGTQFESNGRVKKVRCLSCGHKFSATFFRKDPSPEDVAFCPKCEGLEFEWA